ncbi:MAG: putative rane protein [Holophagaceae bacterium]|nr:putative rane protein [Holophagaceae bacterium]
MMLRKQYDRHLERDIEYSPMVEVVLIVALSILLAAHLGVLGWQITLGKLPFQAMTYTFSTLVLVHAVYLLGWQRALFFFVLTLVVSFVMEYLGVKTGVIFGAYHYTDVLNPKLAGTVPMVIPLAYFMVLYPSRMMADLITWGKAAGVTKGLLWSLFTAVLAAMTMTAWDLSMDPVMVHEVKAWVWERGGPYFGIPLQNFFGWFLTTFIIAFLGECTERYLPLRPLGRLHRTVIYLPLVGYGALCLGGPFVGIPVDTRVISPFTMAVPLLAASLRLFRY